VPKLSILLCTFEGRRYLAAQLGSIEAQSFGDWKLWASDDVSRDTTLPILTEQAASWADDKCSIFQGPSAGFVQNFLSLVCNPLIDSDFYAFADQDDIWEADKLKRALVFLDAASNKVPALYCARTLLVDSENKPIGLSSLYRRRPTFRNALVQNIASGNTMVFNDAARRLLVEAGASVDVFAHDWWTYLLVTGCGGVVTYDPVPSLRYRQHDANQIGTSTGLAPTALRLKSMLSGRYRDWNGRHIEALTRMIHRLTPENAEVLMRFSHARSQPLFRRLISYFRSGVYRQTNVGNVGLVVAAVLNKI
jgi:glycosyltransferase involved in cell wall biosynthesis